MIKVGIPHRYEEGFQIHYMPAVPSRGDWINIGGFTTGCVERIEWSEGLNGNDWVALIHFYKFDSDFHEEINGIKFLEHIDTGQHLTPQPTLERAWEVFSHFMAQTRGKIIYMRVPPALRVETDFETKKTSYLIHCRFSLIEQTDDQESETGAQENAPRKDGS